MRFADLPPLGATPLPEGKCSVLVWAPHADRVSVQLHSQHGRRAELARGEHGYHSAVLDSVRPGDRYSFHLNDGPARPDPASRFQPEGPHGPSQVVDPAFPWTDAAWRPPPLDRHVFYELHVGTYTPAGTFEAIIEHLDELRDLGITALELMPIAQFPGGRNWGYDGVLPSAAQNTYGGPDGLKRLANAAHAAGLAVYLDVVYNHLGPEGNYLGEFGPYFTDRYKTPWGLALNFDGKGSDQVRRYFIDSALYWITECHLDGLRLDAVHAIIDPTPVPFVQELAAAVHQRAEQLGRTVRVIAETAANDARMVRSTDVGGYGLDGQWNDDFHHAAVALVQRSGLKYVGYGGIEALQKALTDGYFFTGEHADFFGRRHGSPSRCLPAERFVIFVQNHDQVGNQRAGERLTDIAPFEAAKLAAGVMLLAPYVPLLFMGEEYAEPAPFLYFVSHTDPELCAAVRRGRREEFRDYGWEGEVPDPADPQTFLRSKLNHAQARGGAGDGTPHRGMLELYRTLLRLRRELPALANLSKDTLRVDADAARRILVLERWEDGNRVLAAFNFNDRPAAVPLRAPPGQWHRLLDSADPRFAGPGADSPDSFTSDIRHPTSDIPLTPHAFATYTLRSA